MKLVIPATVEITVKAMSPLHMDVAHVAFSLIYFQKHRNGIASIHLTCGNVSSLQNNRAVNLENFSSLFKQYADIFTVGKIKVPA